MAVLRHTSSDAAELAAAIEATAGPLISVWAHAADSEQALISGPQLRALRALDRPGGLNLNGLAAELGTIASSVSRLCDRLVAAGLINREPSAATRREISLTLRAAGEELLARLARARRDEITAVLDGMTPTAARALARGLGEFARAAQTHHDRHQQRA